MMQEAGYLSILCGNELWDFVDCVEVFLLFLLNKLVG